MNSSESAQTETPVAGAADKRPAHSLTRRLLLWVTAGLGLLVMMVALMLFWAVNTGMGARFLLATVSDFSLGVFKVQGVQGSLGDRLDIDELKIHTAGLQVEASGLQLQWRPLSLWQKQLNIDSLHISALTIASKSNQEPARLPASLALPIALQANNLALGRLKIADLQADGTRKELVSLQALSGELSYRQQAYQVRLALTSPWGKAETSATLHSLSPYAINAQARLSGQGSADLPAVTAQLLVNGNLQELKLALSGLDARTAEQKALFSGDAHAVIMPFAPQMLQSAQIDLHHLNPQAWSASAPQADLSVKADVRSLPVKNQTDLKLTGQVSIQNTQPGSLDLQRLPVAALYTQISLQGMLLQLSDLEMKLAGNGHSVQNAQNGQVRGHLQLKLVDKAPEASAQLQLSHLNLKAIHQSLQQTAIQGRLDAQTSNGNLITLQAQLQDAKASLEAKAEYDIHQQSIRLQNIELQAENAHVQGSGELALGGKQAFRLKASVANFDPARWVRSPSGRLSADLQADGELSPMRLQVHLTRLQGEYGGQEAQGNLDMGWQAQRLQVAQMHFLWGKNTVSANGNWGNPGDKLNIQIDAPELAAFDVLLESQKIQLRGAVNANLQLQGKMSEPAGKLDISAGRIALTQNAHRYEIGQLRSQISLTEGANGILQGQFTAQNLSGDFPGLPAQNALNNHVTNEKISTLNLELNGQRQAHRIRFHAVFPDQRQLQLEASGGLLNLKNGKQDISGWSGQLQTFSLSGKSGWHLQKAVNLDMSSAAIRLSPLQLQSDLAVLKLDQFEWTPASLKTSGRMIDAKPVDILNLIKPQYALSGNIKVNADWNLQLAEHAQGTLNIERQSGDVRFNDPDGTGVAIPLGMREMQVQIRLGGLVPGSDGEKLNLTMNANGARLGQWNANLSAILSKREGAWTIANSSALSGNAKAMIPDLEWLGPWINPGLVLKGRLQLDAKLNGTLEQPHYRADISGRELEVAFASEGLLLPNGTLDAQIEDSRLRVHQLQFSNTVQMLPKHEQFKDIDLLGKRGEFKASGEVDIGKETGAIQAQWQNFPLLQRTDRWLVVSGQANIVEAENIWSLTGKVSADGAYFKLPKLPPPSLSDDVHVTRRATQTGSKAADNSAPKKGLKTRVDVSFNMGPHFVFVGRGLNTGLAGSLRLRSIDGSPLQATGSINTVKGMYEGYGQQLAIERGILNFQGPPANPGLNIRALRQGLAVEAGVEVVGTVVAPQVRLVSEPDVPDAEKLSWLVLGRGSDQLAGGDASLLMSAATAIFGGDGSRNIPRDLAQGLGFDEFSIGASGSSFNSHLPGQTVAGTTGASSNTSTSSDQVLSVGKHLMPGLVLSVERGLSDASGAVKLTWQLTRRVTIVGRTGSESAVDVNYTFSFN